MLEAMFKITYYTKFLTTVDHVYVRAVTEEEAAKKAATIKDNFAVAIAVEKVPTIGGRF